MDGERRGDGAGASGSGSGGAPPPGKGGGSGEQDAGRGTGARDGGTDIVADIFGEDAGLNVVMLLMVLAYLINYATTKCIC